MISLFQVWLSKTRELIMVCFEKMTDDMIQQPYFTDTSLLHNRRFDDCKTCLSSKIFTSSVNLSWSSFSPSIQSLFSLQRNRMLWSRVGGNGMHNRIRLSVQSLSWNYQQCKVSHNITHRTLLSIYIWTQGCYSTSRHMLHVDVSL